MPGSHLKGRILRVIEYVYSDLHALYTQLKSSGIASVILAGRWAGMPILLPILLASQALQMPV
jgi:hypothetical protein